MAALTVYGFYMPVCRTGRVSAYALAGVRVKNLEFRFNAGFWEWLLKYFAAFKPYLALIQTDKIEARDSGFLESFSNKKSNGIVFYH